MNDPIAPIPPSSFPIAKVLGAIGPFIALIVLMVVMRIALGSNYWSADNLCGILAQTAIVAIAACGMTMIIVAGGIDLSVGSVVALSAVLAALTLNAGWSPLVAILVAMLSGALIGTCNGVLIAGWRMSPFIVTLGMMGIARGAAKLCANSQSVNSRPSWLDWVMKPVAQEADPEWLKALVVAPGVWIALIIAIVMGLLMSRSVFGRYIYAIGSNEAGARLCGIRVPLIKIMLYSIAGALVGLGGLLEMARLHQGDSTTATGRELDVIAAVVIGGASLSGGAGTILGTMIGALIMAILRNGTQQLGWENAHQEIIIGVVIILAVRIDQLRQRRTL